MIFANTFLACTGIWLVNALSLAYPIRWELVLAGAVVAISTVESSCYGWIFAVSAAAVLGIPSMLRVYAGYMLAVLHFVSTAALLWTNSYSKYYAASQVLAHCAAFLLLLVQLCKQQVWSLMDKILLIDGVRVAKLIICGNLTKNDLCPAEYKQWELATKPKFNWIQTESLCAIRAALRMIWKPLLIIRIASLTVTLLSHYHHLLLIQIFSELSQNTDNTRFKQLVALWVLLHMLIPIKKYIDIERSKVVMLLQDAPKEYFMKYYLKNKSNFETSYFNPTRTIHISGFVADIVRLSTELLESVLMQAFSVYSIASKLGYISAMVIIASITLSAGIHYVKRHLDEYIRKQRAKQHSNITIDTVVTNMRAIKQYGWETKLGSKIQLLGAAVLPWYITALKGLLDRAASYGPNFVVFIVALSFVRSNPSVTYFEISALMYEISSLIKYTESFSSVSLLINYYKRINGYIMKGSKYSNYVYVSRKPASANERYAIEMSQCNFSWGEEKYALQPINLNVETGTFVAIKGKVGSGKSSLLSAMCGEMPLTDGAGTVYGTIGYVSQKPWIMNATFRYNVLFGNDYEEDFYMQVIRACALEDDIKQLPAGDMTEIGFKGINLSGGQKARLALARAIYSKADIYVLDDILSAVDAQVERHLVENVLTGNGILRNKTRILVTHADHVIPLSDMQLTMDEGGIVASDNIPGKVSGAETATVEEDGDLPEKSSEDEADEYNLHPEAAASKYNYWLIPKFISLVGYKVTMLLLVIQVVRVFAYHILNTKRLELAATCNTHMAADALQQFVILSFVLNIITTELAKQTDNITYDIAFDKAVVNMRAKLLSHILSAKLTTLERLSQYTVSNLFTFDIEQTGIGMIINMIGQSYIVFDAITTVLGLQSTLLVLVIIAAAPVLFVGRINQYYIRLKETYDSKVLIRQRAKMEEMVPELSQGQDIIRIHGKADAFVKLMSDTNTEFSIMYTRFSILSHLKDFCIEIVEMLIGLLTLLYLKYVANEGVNGPGDVERWYFLTRSLHSSLITLTGNEYSFSSTLPSLATYYAYAEDIEQEAPQIIADHPAPKDWPQKGIIKFNNYSLRYRDELDVVLQDLSFTIGQNEKVGIVGRTGAGKSSLSFALLRLVEAASGSILIDGIDISLLGLSDLRSRISMVPQDPMLFKGTIRDNLDPGSEYPDEELLSAISKAHINNLLNTDDSKGQTGLLTEVEDNGQNFSVGQRQLISLCRALLWKRKIVILDEATANIDTRTDQLMQSIIRKEFSECTVLTIAHRLKTVMDSDRIMVMDQGKCVEFDTPSNLLARDGHFSKLVKSMEFNESKSQT